MGRPTNDSGHGSGLYCSDEQAAAYIDRMSDYLRRRNARWLDRWTGPDGEVRAGVGELPGVWEADSYLAEWCAQRGLLERSTVPVQGIQWRQIGRLTGVVYNRSDHGRRAIAFALERWLDEVESRMAEEVERASVCSG